jgi:hypothetical protein
LGGTSSLRTRILEALERETQTTEEGNHVDESKNKYNSVDGSSGYASLTRHQYTSIARREGEENTGREQEEEKSKRPHLFLLGICFFHA